MNDSDWDNDTDTDTWNAIESDAGIFTTFMENLGVKEVQCEELLTLDPADLQAIQPLYGVIFLFKYPTDGPYSSPDGPVDGTYDEDAARRIYFARQTIRNACGTQALLSILLNKSDEIEIGHVLSYLRGFAIAMVPEMRGHALSNATRIKQVHNALAVPNLLTKDMPQTGEAGDAFHFIAYTQIRGTLYELDGLQPAPISHGPCTADAFPAQVVDVLQRRIARYDASEIRFNLMAMCRDLRLKASEWGDDEMMDKQLRQREQWNFENALRQHKLLSFASEVLEILVRVKIEEEGEEWLPRWVRESAERRAAEERGEGGA